MLLHCLLLKQNQCIAVYETLYNLLFSPAAFLIRTSLQMLSFSETQWILFNSEQKMHMLQRPMVVWFKLNKLGVVSLKVIMSCRLGWHGLAGKTPLSLLVHVLNLFQVSFDYRPQLITMTNKVLLITNYKYNECNYNSCTAFVIY